MKFWKWIVGFKVKRIRDDERIIYLASKLWDELKAQGYKLRGKNQEVAGFEVSRYDHCPGEIDVYSILCDWRITGKKDEVATS